MKITPIKVKTNSSQYTKNSIQKYDLSFLGQQHDNNSFETSKKYAQNICRLMALTSFTIAAIWLIFKK